MRCLFKIPFVLPSSQISFNLKDSTHTVPLPHPHQLEQCRASYVSNAREAYQHSYHHQKPLDSGAAGRASTASHKNSLPLKGMKHLLQSRSCVSVYLFIFPSISSDYGPQYEQNVDTRQGVRLHRTFQAHCLSPCVKNSHPPCRDSLLFTHSRLI
ncbi:hypothetical protein BJV74DRAFT_538211 [Russula compacta]|nr:hypothetical protein BJV74DRAFT_538211 [Russula compacta]